MSAGIAATGGGLLRHGGKSEVEDLDSTRWRDHDVRRLQITMSNALVVRRQDVVKSEVAHADPVIAENCFSEDMMPD